MGKAASKINDTVKDKITAIAVVATLAFIFSIAALIVHLLSYYTTSCAHNNVVNLSAVPGQTDVTGNIKVMGELHLASWLEAQSATEASFTTKGGISALGKVIAERGIISKYMDSNEILRIGPDTQTGIEMGREDFPVHIKGNQLLVECNKTITRDILPLDDKIYSLGSKENRWNNIYLDGNISNQNGFVTKAGSSGMYSHLDYGPLLTGKMTTYVSLVPVSGLSLNGFVRKFAIDTITAGDSFQITMAGTLIINNPEDINNVIFGIVCNGINYYVPLTIKGDLLHRTSDKNPLKDEHNAYEDTFILKSTFHAHQPRHFSLLTEVEWSCFKNRFIDNIVLSEYDEFFDWDLKMNPYTLGLEGSIQAKTCVMTKIY
jgi:hypothetical protein